MFINRFVGWITAMCNAGAQMISFIRRAKCVNCIHNVKCKQIGDGDRKKNIWLWQRLDNWRMQLTKVARWPRARARVQSILYSGNIHEANFGQTIDSATKAEWTGEREWARERKINKCAVIDTLCRCCCCCSAAGVFRVQITVYTVIFNFGFVVARIIYDLSS